MNDADGAASCQPTYWTCHNAPDVSEGSVANHDMQKVRSEAKNQTACPCMLKRIRHRLRCRPVYSGAFFFGRCESAKMLDDTTLSYCTRFREI